MTLRTYMTSTELVKKHNELVAAVRACLHVARTGSIFLERTDEFASLKALEPKKAG